MSKKEEVSQWKRSLEIPSGAMPEVITFVLDNGIQYEFTGADTEEDEVYMDVFYSRDERDTIHQLADLIEDYEAPDSDDDDE